MQVLVDISMYPLQDQFIPHIDTFIYNVRENDQLEVVVTDTSTTIRGDYDEVMNELQFAMNESLKEVPCSFNLRILGGRTAQVENKHK